MTPVPLAPPVLLVLLTSAPAGQETSVSVPGTNARSRIERVQLVEDPDVVERSRSALRRRSV